MHGAYSSSMYPMKVPVHKIQSCFTMCRGVRKLRLYHTGANAAVLMHFMLITQISIPYEQVKTTIFLQMPQT